MTSTTKLVGALTLSGFAFGALFLLHAATPAQVERGRYIVDQISGCNDCHTPMGAKGLPDFTRRLQGAPLTFRPIGKVPEWADTAPALAGLVGYTDAEIVRVLTTHIGPKGTPLRPPMPEFRFTKEDAAAVAAYIRTLKPAAPPAGKR